jgi:hypothetical protein
MDILLAIFGLKMLPTEVTSSYELQCNPEYNIRGSNSEIIFINPNKYNVQHGVSCDKIDDICAMLPIYNKYLKIFQHSALSRHDEDIYKTLSDPLIAKTDRPRE